MRNFAVIDTETNWIDQVMSIGIVIADKKSLMPVARAYHVLAPEYEIGGMYEHTLFGDDRLQTVILSRKESLQQLVRLLTDYGVRDLFAYNAGFDRNHLPELGCFVWYDIMRKAAYRQTNPKIPSTADCFSTGRLKRGYGVEAMLRLLSGRTSYYETHNALYDALDELEILRLLGHPLSSYTPL